MAAVASVACSQRLGAISPALEWRLSLAIETWSGMWRCTACAVYAVAGRGRRSHLWCNPGEAHYDLIVLTTQPTDAVEAAQTYYPRLSAAGELVVLQNGLCEARVAAALGTHAGALSAVWWPGARTHTLGTVEQTSEGAVVFGRLDVNPSVNRDALVKLFEQIATVGFTDNLLGTRWSKLIINSVVSSLGTVNGTQLGEVVRSVQGRRVGLKILSEGVAVANAHGISLEPIAGTIDLNALAQPLSGERPRFWKNIYAHLVLCIVGFKYRKLYSSMLRALESGRAPAIDFLNGELVDAGHRAGSQRRLIRLASSCMCPQWAMKLWLRTSARSSPAAHTTGAATRRRKQASNDDNPIRTGRIKG